MRSFRLNKRVSRMYRSLSRKIRRVQNISKARYTEKLRAVFCRESHISPIFAGFPMQMGQICDSRQYSSLGNIFKNLVKAKKRDHRRNFANVLFQETSMRTLWTLGRRMRNAVSGNEDREISPRWIFDFEQKSVRIRSK